MISVKSFLFHLKLGRRTVFLALYFPIFYSTNNVSHNEKFECLRRFLFEHRFVVIRNIILALSSPLKHWLCMRELCGGREQAHVDAGLWWGIVVRRLKFYDLNLK